MKYFSIIVTAYIPYPITFEYLEKATGFGTAINRAVRRYRKEPRVARKRIDNLIVKVGKATS